jgi:hypothetical protein
LRFFEIFRSGFREHVYVFLGSPCRETAKNAINKNKIDGKDDRGKKKSLSFFGQKLLTSDMDLPQKVFLGGVFELPLLRNAHKRHKKKN